MIETDRFSRREGAGDIASLIMTSESTPASLLGDDLGESVMTTAVVWMRVADSLFCFLDTRNSPKFNFQKIEKLPVMLGE